MFSSLKFSSISSMFLFMYSFIVFPFSCLFLLSKNSFLLDWDIISISSCSLNMMILVDGISLSFSNVVCLISACVMMFSSSYMAGDKYLKRFIWLVVLFVMSMNLLIFIPSLPALLLGWDGLGIVSFALVIYYQNNKSLGAGLLTLLANRIGDVMILISIGLLVLQGHWVSVLMWDFSFSGFVVMGLLLASMTKSAQIPFSAWLPAAMAAPTPVSALVHSSTLVTAGVYLVIRFHPFLSQLSGFGFCLLFISVLTLLMAGVGAVFENDLKKVIALSTLSQLGVMMLSLSMNMVSLSLFHLYTHALFKALLFLCAGAIIHGCLNNQDLRYMGMMSSQFPLTVTCMNIANLSLCGAPFLSGFYSKDLILQSCLMSPVSMFMLALIFLATGFTLLYTFRLSFCCLWSSSAYWPLHTKQEYDLYINASTSILSIFAILSGFLLQVVFLDFSGSLIMIPTSTSLIAFSTIGSGLLVGWVITYSNYSFDLGSKMKSFVSTMWFLALLSSQPLTKFSMLLGTKLVKSVDQGWLEILGGQGALMSSSNLSVINQRWQMSLFNLLIVSSFVVVFWSVFFAM